MKKDLSKITANMFTCTEYIRQNVSLASRYAQLAEELTEMSHAAQKLSRYYAGDNPPADDVPVLEQNLYEELADTINAMDALGIHTTAPSIVMMQKRKLIRWVERIAERKEKAKC